MLKISPVFPDGRAAPHVVAYLLTTWSGIRHICGQQIGQDRLSFLALAFIYRTMTVNITDMVKEFSCRPPRKIALPIILFDH